MSVPNELQPRRPTAAECEDLLRDAAAATAGCLVANALDVPVHVGVRIETGTRRLAAAAAPD